MFVYWSYNTFESITCFGKKVKQGEEKCIYKTSLAASFPVEAVTVF